MFLKLGTTTGYYSCLKQINTTGYWLLVTTHEFAININVYNNWVLQLVTTTG